MVRTNSTEHKYIEKLTATEPQPFYNVFFSNFKNRARWDAELLGVSLGSKLSAKLMNIVKHSKMIRYDLFCYLINLFYFSNVIVPKR